MRVVIEYWRAMNNAELFCFARLTDPLPQLLCVLVHKLIGELLVRLHGVTRHANTITFEVSLTINRLQATWANVNF